tara:strand:- start:128 stop:301 length:174 start_codon:yes stop_codon:yes gene_type:complete
VKNKIEILKIETSEKPEISVIKKWKTIRKGKEKNAKTLSNKVVKNTAMVEICFIFNK